MKMAESKYHLSGIELCRILCESLYFMQMSKEFSTLDERHDKKYLIISLKDESQSDQERVANLLHHLLL